MTDPDSVSHTVPIHEVFAPHHAILRLASHLTEYSVKILTERGYSFTATAEREIVPGVIEKLSYIGLDYDTELKSIAEIDKKKTYQLSARNIISAGAERIRCVKVFFQPSSNGKEASGFYDTSFLYNMNCHVDTRKELHANVVFSGGTTMCQRIFERMTKELTALAPSTMKIKVVPPLRYGLEDLFCLPSFFNRCGFRKANTESGPVFMSSPFWRATFRCHIFLGV